MAGVFVGLTLGPRDVTCEDILYMFNIVYNVSDYYMIWSILYRTVQDRTVLYSIRRAWCSYVYCSVINMSKTVDAELGQKQKISGNITSHMMRSDSQMPYRNLFFLNI